MIPKQIRTIINARRNYRISKAAFSENLPLLSRFPINLSLEEKREVDSVWSIFPVKSEWNYMYHSTFKSLYGFDKHFVPSCCYYPYILRSLNRTKEYEILEHKGLSQLYLHDIPQPYTPLRIINGIAYDCDYKPLKNYAFIDYLLDINKSQELIVKQAKDTCCGLNIKFIPIGSTQSAIRNILNEFNTDIIVQTIIKQSPVTALLNPTSVNTFRISTLNLNGYISPVSVMIKAGSKGHKVDNVGGGNGGALVGVAEDGYVSQKGFSSVGELVKTPLLPKVNISEIKDFAVMCHNKLPHIGVVGWDIALDEENKPLMIEANLHWSGITGEQIVSGPFFGERTGEVISYITRNRFW